MSEEIEIAGIKVPKADWEGTPASIQALVLVLSERLKQQDERIRQLEERLNQNSQNSSKPPASDGFGQSLKPQKQRPKRHPRGKSKPSPRQVRKLMPSAACDQVQDVLPSVCADCGAPVTGHDPHPHRHQEMELPPIVPLVVEYRLHQLGCQVCGHQTRASLPTGVSPSGYGARLSAIVALLSGPYRQSYRQVCALMTELFGVRLSRGTVGRLRDELNVALHTPVATAQDYVAQQPVLHSDETSFPQGNRDGRNPQRTKGWLWVLVTPLVSFYEVVLSRSQQTAKDLIDDSYGGIVVSDRYSAYNWIALAQRQLCWAHLKRDLTAMAERLGLSSDIGEALLRRQQRLFRWWHQVRDGTLSREQFRHQVTYLRHGFKSTLEVAAALPIAPHEKSPLAKTVRTCRQLLKVEPALWTFVFALGVEPTNNAAERVLRPAVIWRKTSFGSQAQTGSQFVARLMTVTTSLKAQGRDILDFLTQVYSAARTGKEPPSLIPQDQR
jgi:hypothetical protein